MAESGSVGVSGAVKARRAHGVVAVAAVLASLLAHVVMLAELPPLPLGRLLDEQPWQDFPAIELGDVEPMRAKAARPPARFRPENPGEAAELYGAADPGSMMADIPLPVPEAPEISTGPVRGEAEALAEPGALPERRAWDPREEIVQIDHQVFDEQISALPRRYAPAAERTSRVPDVVLPVEQPADLVLALGGGGVAGIESASRPTVRDRGGVGGPDLDDAVGAMGGGGTPLPDELADLPVEKSQGVQPVEQYLDLDVQAFRAADESGAVYFRLEIRRDGEAELPVLPRDVLFLQDCSESMTPSKLAECKRGLRRWLDLLNPGDRFEIIGFRDTVSRCFGEWRVLSPETKALALNFIDGLRAVGNTDVYASLQAALQVERDPKRPLLAIIATDGRPTVGVVGSSEIIEGFTRSNQGHTSVFALGGGRRVNKFLLDLLGYRNRGDALVVENEEAIPAAMERWAQEVRRPVLTDLQFRFAGVDDLAVYPATLTHLYLDRPLVLFGRVDRLPERAAFQIVGRSGAHVRDMVFPLDLGAAAAGGAELRQYWAWQRIYQWIGEYTATQDPALLQRIRDFADRYGLVVPYGYGESVPR